MLSLVRLNQGWLKITHIGYYQFYFVLFCCVLKLSLALFNFRYILAVLGIYVGPCYTFKTVVKIGINSHITSKLGWLV